MYLHKCFVCIQNFFCPQMFSLASIRCMIMANQIIRCHLFTPFQQQELLNVKRRNFLPYTKHSCARFHANTCIHTPAHRHTFWKTFDLILCQRFCWQWRKVTLSNKYNFNMHNQKIYWNSFEVAKVASRRTTIFNRTISKRSTYHKINFATVEKERGQLCLLHV